MGYSYFFRRMISATIAIIFLMTTTVAQSSGDKKVKGKVLDAYGHELSNVRVQIKGQTLFVHSNEDGVFEIKANKGNVLVFSAPNFNVSEYTISKNEADIVVRLSESYLRDSKEIDVLYEKSKAKNLNVGAIDVVYTPQISTTPATLYAYALPGKMAGLYTEQMRGFRNYTGKGDKNFTADIGGNFAKTGLTGFSDNNEMAIRLRGQSPVVIVDGIQRDIYSLDPESIESISVLKDGLSALALGQRSSRGVLMVTTKKPMGGAPKLSFTTEVAMQEPLKLPTPVNSYEYAYLMNEALQNEGKQTLYSLADLDAYKKGTDPIGHPNVNWYDEVLRKSAPLYRYNLNLTGGGKMARYAIAVNYMNQEGLLNVSNIDAKMKLERYLINSRVDIDVTEDFNISVHLFGRIQDANQPGSTAAGILDDLIRTPNNAYPIFNPDNSYGGTTSFQTNLKASLNNSGYIMNSDRDIMANVDLSYKLDKVLPGLWVKAKGNIAVQSATATERIMRVPTFQMHIGSYGDTAYTRVMGGAPQGNEFIPVANARYWYGQGTLGYDKKIGMHNLQATLMADSRRSTLNYDLSATAINYMAKVNYNYDEKYMAEVAMNYSGFDRYEPGNQFGMFYGVGAGWDMAKESFIKDNASWINTLKLRATYARTGNGVDNSGYFIWRQVFRNNNQGNGYAGIDHGAATIAKLEGSLANTGITWEKADKFDIGLDVSLFDKHLQITADYYRDLYFDLLQTRGKSIALMGKDYPNENIGKNLYTGGELTVTYQNNIGALNYFVTANGSLEKTKIVFMDEQRRDYEWNKRTGQPIGQRFGYITEGYFTSEADVAASALLPGYDVKTGDIKFKDLNNDGTIDQFDQTALGKTSPLLYYGLTAGFNYKGFGFSILLQGVANRNLYLDNWNTAGTRGYGQVYGQIYEQLLSRWTPETAAYAQYPRLKANNAYGDQYTLSSSSQWMHSGDYWRVKNIHLEYTLPYMLTNKIKLAGVTVFVNAQNLFTWSAYDRVDPEVPFENAYPIQRVINAGFNIKF